MTKKFLLRINPELWEELNRWAGDELRSVNGQIEYLLRQAVEKRKRAVVPPQSEPPRATDES
jgi:hypothetical protein